MFTFVDTAGTICHFRFSSRCGVSHLHDSLHLGQEQYADHRQDAIETADGFLLVYDVTQK